MDLNDLKDDEARKSLCLRAAKDMWQARILPLLVLGPDVDNPDETLVLTNLSNAEQIALFRRLANNLEMGLSIEESERLQ